MGPLFGLLTAALLWVVHHGTWANPAGMLHAHAAWTVSMFLLTALLLVTPAAVLHW